MGGNGTLRRSRIRLDRVTFTNAERAVINDQCAERATIEDLILDALTAFGGLEVSKG